jgi:hypothetical protein
VNGSWLSDTDYPSGYNDLIAEFLGEAHLVDLPDFLDFGTFVPVLVRTQYTTVDPITHAKTVTYLTPPEISDVASAAFYGITSQVSRKYILPT